jgi:hypothetical protein
MRIFHVQGEPPIELEGLPDALPSAGFPWLDCTRESLAQRIAEVQAALQR